MEPHDPSPSEIRTTCLNDHRRLRAAAAQLADHVRACECTELRAPLAEAIVALLDQLRAHLELEDAALAYVDPRGSLSWACLQERRRVELSRLGELLERLAEPLRDGPLGAHVLDFVDWIDQELTREEREQLDADLLHAAAS